MTELQMTIARIYLKTFPTDVTWEVLTLLVASDDPQVTTWDQFKLRDREKLGELMRSAA